MQEFQQNWVSVNKWRSRRLLCRQNISLHNYIIASRRPMLYYKKAAHFQKTSSEDCHFISTHIVLVKLLHHSQTIYPYQTLLLVPLVHIKKMVLLQPVFQRMWEHFLWVQWWENIMLTIMTWESLLSYSISIGVSIDPTGFVQPLLPKIYIDSLFKFLPTLGYKMTDSKLGAE